MKRGLWIAVGVGLAAAVAWVGSGAASWLQLQHRLLSAAKRASSAVATVEVEGVVPFPMYLNPHDAVVTRGIWSTGVWEENETHWFVRSVRPGDVVVDVGANVGYYTLLAAELVGENGRVYAFEPDPTNFGVLERNVRMNGYRNVVLEQKAVSREAGSIQLFLAPENMGDHRIYQPAGESRPSIEIEAVALDDYFDAVEDSVDFVKVDTQGAEGVILEGMTRLIARSPELVMAVEYAPFALAEMGYSGERVLGILAPLGMSMFDLGAGGYGVRREMHPLTLDKIRKRVPESSGFFTNLLLVKGRPALVRSIVRGGAPAH